MPNIKQTPPVQIRLLPADHTRFDLICRNQNKKRTDLAREALIYFLENHNHVVTDNHDNVLEKRLKKMEDRLAKLQVKASTDIGMVLLLMYRNMNKDERDKVMQWAHAGSVKRLRNKLTDLEIDLVEKTKTNDSISNQA